METLADEFRKIIKKSPYFWLNDKPRKFLKVLGLFDNNNVKVYVFKGDHNDFNSINFKNYIANYYLTEFFYCINDELLSQIPAEWGRPIEEDFLEMKEYEYFFYDDVPYRATHFVKTFNFDGDNSKLPIYKSIILKGLIDDSEMIVNRCGFRKLVPCNDKNEVEIRILSSISCFLKNLKEN